VSYEEENTCTWPQVQIFFSSFHSPSPPPCSKAECACAHEHQKNANKQARQQSTRLALKSSTDPKSPLHFFSLTLSPSLSLPLALYQVPDLDQLVRQADIQVFSFTEKKAYIYIYIYIHIYIHIYTEKLVFFFRKGKGEGG
jgi:hypothetical protein